MVVLPKGKAKAAAAHSAKRNKLNNNDEDVNGEHADSAMEEDDSRVDPQKTYWRSDPQVERWQGLCEDVKQQRDAFSKQLEELFRLRQTEPERLLQEQKSQYEVRLKVYEDTIRELQASLYRADTPAQPETSTSLHFLTRETAEKEKQDIQREVTRLKGIITEKDAALLEKDKEITSLNTELKTLRSDLVKEIENTKALVARNPPSVSKQTKTDPKHALVIRLYEEFTNILITHVKHEQGFHKEDFLIYTCVLTGNNHMSLNFSLKVFDEYEEDTPGHPQLISKVIYTPLELEKESDDFIDQLQFLSKSFTFRQEQMSVFLKTLSSHIDNESEDQSQMEEA